MPTRRSDRIFLRFRFRGRLLALTLFPQVALAISVRARRRFFNEF
jgi:hypothetical protein